MNPDHPASQPTAILAACSLWLVDVLYSVIFRFPHLTSLAGGLPAPETLFLGSPTIIDGFLRALGANGRDIYREMQLVDFAGSLFMVFAGVVLIRWLRTQLPADRRWPRWLLLLPWLAGAADAVENILTIRTITLFPALTPRLLPWVTSLKLSLIVALLLSVAGLAAIALRLRRLAPVMP